MNLLLAGVLAAIIVFVIYFFWTIYREDFFRLLFEMVASIGLAYLVMLAGWSLLFAYMALGLSLFLIFFIKRRGAF